MFLFKRAESVNGIILFSSFALSLKFFYHNYNTFSYCNILFSWVCQPKLMRVPAEGARTQGKPEYVCHLTFLILQASIQNDKQTIKQILLACNDHLLKSLTFTKHFSLFGCSSPPAGRWCRACGSTVPQSLSSSSSSPSVLMDRPRLPHNLLNLRARLEGENVSLKPFCSTI